MPSLNHRIAREFCSLQPETSLHSKLHSVTKPSLSLLPLSLCLSLSLSPSHFFPLFICPSICLLQHLSLLAFLPSLTHTFTFSPLISLSFPHSCPCPSLSPCILLCLSLSLSLSLSLFPSLPATPHPPPPLSLLLFLHLSFLFALTH